MSSPATITSAFPTLVWVVVAVSALVAIWTLARTGRSYDEIGANRLGGDDDDSAYTSAAERDAEIRQLIEAQNVHRVRRGEPPLDVDAEVKRRLSEPT